MLPDRVSNPGPLTYESGALPIVLRGPANRIMPAYQYLKSSFESLDVFNHCIVRRNKNNVTVRLKFVKFQPVKELLEKS